ncbi:hypothetical protein BDR07DRAFT_1485529 [Suillus spraguei]|nr:hypothetical protein BDR07DRAFT_1485529 [Suillus spraguei]
MSNVRERFQWASSRITTLQEDVAYSLFRCPSTCNLRREEAECARTTPAGDRGSLSSGRHYSIRNSPFTTPSLSEDEIQTIVSSLQNIVTVEPASKLYTLLDKMGAPRFAHCRLHLPCIVFRVTEVRRRRNVTVRDAISVIYGVKADGLQDLLITTKEKLTQFTPARPIRQTVLLVCPWNRYLLEPAEIAEPPDFGDDALSEDEYYWSAPGSLFDESSGSSDGGQDPVDSKSFSRAL